MNDINDQRSGIRLSRQVYEMAMHLIVGEVLNSSVRDIGNEILAIIDSSSSDSSTDDEVEFNSLLKLVRKQINKLNIVNFYNRL